MKYLLITGYTSLMLNSSVNPIIYNAVNPRYRKAFAETFLRRYYDHKKTRTSTDMTADKTDQLELQTNI